MKKYLYKLFAISTIFLLLITTLLLVKAHIVKTIDWKLPQEKHILFMGASHVYHAIDDSMLESAVNLGKPSERYMYSYIKLQEILKVNPQIDTIFLQCSSTDLWQDTDYKYHMLNEQSFYVKTYWPLYNKEEWQVFDNEPISVLNIIVSSVLNKREYSRNYVKESMGGFAPLSISRGEMDSTTVTEDLEINHIKEYGDYGTSVNYLYLRKFIELCNNKNIKLYLVYYPVYKPELFYDQSFCDTSREKYFSDVEYLDYSHWPCSGRERMDAHHLNWQGAKLFTQFIKDSFGIK